MPSKPLNIPLYKRSHTGLWHMLACIPLAIITVRPGTVENWLTTIFLVFPILWFVFVGPKFLDGWLRHSRYSFLSWVILALKLVLFFWVIKIVEPYTASLLSEWLKA
jgi:hypothetical protein